MGDVALEVHDSGVGLRELGLLGGHYAVLDQLLGEVGEGVLVDLALPAAEQQGCEERRVCHERDGYEVIQGGLQVHQEVYDSEDEADQHDVVEQG